MSSNRSGRSAASLSSSFSKATSASAIASSSNGPDAENVKFSPVISVRVNREERTRLEREAQGLTLSAYVRQRLLGDGGAPRKTRGKYPNKDQKALARVLGLLGRSDIYNNMHRLLLAVEEGRVILEADLENELRQSCADVTAMRQDLMAALGLDPN